MTIHYELGAHWLCITPCPHGMKIEDGKLIEETACNSDWKIMNGHHYCPSCWERDDDDIIHTKDGRKWDDSDIEVVEVTEE